MLTHNSDKKRDQLKIFCMDDLVPQDHLLRLIDVLPGTGCGAVLCNCF